MGMLRRNLIIMKVTQNTPSYSSSRHVLAVKVRMAGVNWDYHFIRLRKSEQQWSFKAGWYGPVFRLNAGLKPNQITWYGYSCKDGKTWKPDNGLYNGALYYIAYK